MPQPEITFRHGLCSASIWEQDFDRDGEKLTVRTVSFQRSYLDKDGKLATHQQPQGERYTESYFDTSTGIRISH